MNNKTASMLLETVFSILLLSLVCTSAILIYKNFFDIHHQDYHNELSNIELLNTKYFLQQNIKSSADISKIQWQDGHLYFNEVLLLNKVNEFTIKNNNGYLDFTLCIQNRRCKEFLIQL